MAAALSIARRGLGRVWPNPAVGCLIVREGRVVGRGWTRPGGRPHAETEALRRAGELARRATVYVTLEPCNHHGKTPPCASALVEAGVARVVAAMADPDPRTAGAGFESLRRAGIEVDEGCLAEAAARLNAGFLSRITRGRPLVTLKAAASLDGRIATGTGHSQWITGEAARARGHLLRADHDAILVGIGTVIADDPSLTCRLPGLQDRSPVRVVLDSHLRIPEESALVRTAREAPVWVVCRDDADRGRMDVLTRAGLDVMPVSADDSGRPDPNRVLRGLGDRGLTRLLIEGGAAVSASFLGRGLVDRLSWFRAPRLIGGDGIPAIGALGVDKLGDTPYFTPSGRQSLPPDLLETFELDNFETGR